MCEFFPAWSQELRVGWGPSGPQSPRTPTSLPLFSSAWNSHNSTIGSENNVDLKPENIAREGEETVNILYIFINLLRQK